MMVFFHKELPANERETRKSKYYHYLTLGPNQGPRPEMPSSATPPKHQILLSPPPQPPRVPLLLPLRKTHMISGPSSPSPLTVQ